MKKSKYISNLFTITVLASVVVMQAACRKDLLNQRPRTELAAAAFWKTEADAQYALNGLYAAVRPCFDRDYYMDGHGEYTRVRGGSTTSGNLRLGDAYNGATYSPSGYAGNWDKMYRYLFGAVNRANYVIANGQTMIAEGLGTPANIELIIGEARFLRALAYFKLISMWGDVPYFGVIINSNAEVASIPRIPIGQVRDSILADLQFAFEKLPVKASALGRASKPAVLAIRGKLNLYWGSWKKNGWPELEGFKQDAAEATAAFTAAAADFKSVINKLPNYYHLFTPKANGNPEAILVFTHGGTGTGQGEELMRDFAGRSHEGSQCWVSPRYEIANRYQSLTTGDFLPPMVTMNPTTDPTARTAPNSTVNPQSYADRDYRMKATIQWDYEMSIGMASLASTGMVPFIYNTWAARVVIDGVTYTSYNTDGSNSGYVFRKFVRNYAGQGRSEGDFAWPVVRLADVYLMYAEATNEVSGPQADAIDLVNKVRHRGNLPPLGAAKIATKQTFFDAIEQERIIELVGEGQRGFDLRRWRKLEQVWGGIGGPGVWRIDTHGAQKDRYFQNASDRAFAQCYIFRIPESERNTNPNLTQNIPWR
jgi:hypothetical protein